MPCAGLLEALHNEAPSPEPAPSPTARLHAAYEPISEAELLADGLIEPVRPLARVLRGFVRSTCRRRRRWGEESGGKLEALANMCDQYGSLKP